MLVWVLTYSPAALPSTTRAAPAKKRTLSIVNSRSKSATPFGLPTLALSRLESSAALALITSANLCSAVERSAGVVRDQLSKAALAASTARSTSASPPLGTSAITSSVAGLMTWVVSPPAASDQSPLMNIRKREAVTVMASPRLAGGRRRCRAALLGSGAILPGGHSSPCSGRKPPSAARAITNSRSARRFM